MYIYLINREGSSQYKIGVSKDTKNRLKALQTANSETLILIKEFETRYGFKLENIIHRNYLHKKVQGEWFELELKDVVGFMDTCRKAEENLKLLEEQNTYIQDKKSW